MAYSHETRELSIFLAGRRIWQRAGSAASGMRENGLRKMRSDPAPCPLFDYPAGFSIEKKTWRRALMSWRPPLVHVSKERVQVELTKHSCPTARNLSWKTEAAGLAPYISKTFRRYLRRGKSRKLCKAEFGRKYVQRRTCQLPTRMRSNGNGSAAGLYRVRGCRCETEHGRG